MTGVEWAVCWRIQQIMFSLNFFLIFVLKITVMNSELLLQRFNTIPEDLQLQVLDYIDFLINRYKIHDKENPQEELSPEIKELLDKRIADFEKNPHKVKPWQEIEDRLLKKHKYAL